MSRVPFEAHVELLRSFLDRRDEIVETIQGLLNAQRKPLEYLRDSSLLSRLFEDSFFTLAGVSHSGAHLRGQLEDAHAASGFKPRELPGLHNGLVDPAEMMVRGFHLWQQTRWPGRNGRVHYAHTLFNLYLIRCLELLSMRLWDEGNASAGARLSQIQAVLDRLWAMRTAGQPVLVRDARWLIQLAQSPATDDLGAYFVVAAQIAESLAPEDRIEIHKAGVCLTGGHLRSQIRYQAMKRNVPLDDQGLVLSTRNTNALDFALLVQDLVPLLEVYESACRSRDDGKRLQLADAICQGISPDPELFLNRVELLGPYSMIEDLFITTDRDGTAGYTPMGRRHVQLLEQYAAQIDRVAKPLSDDCARFRPVAGTCSPYGVLYGFASDLLEHMALKTLQSDAVTQFTVEDVFVSEDGSSSKLEWVNGWRKLPHLTREVQELFAYPQQFAEDVFDRIAQALRTRVESGANPSGRIFIVAGEALDLPPRFVVSSGNEAGLASHRREGNYLTSYRTPAGWVAITKGILTEVLEAGQDLTIAGLPPEAVGVLTLMCRNLLEVPPAVER